MGNLKTYKMTGIPGATFVQSSGRVALVTLIAVHRNGMQYYPTTTIPTGTEAFYYHDINTGIIYFSPDLPFAGGPGTGVPRETVFVIYRA